MIKCLNCRRPCRIDSELVRVLLVERAAYRPKPKPFSVDALPPSDFLANVDEVLKHKEYKELTAKIQSECEDHARSIRELSDAVKTAEQGLATKQLLIKSLTKDQTDKFMHWIAQTCELPDLPNYSTCKLSLENKQVRVELSGSFQQKRVCLLGIRSNGVEVTPIQVDRTATFTPFTPQEQAFLAACAKHYHGLVFALDWGKDLTKTSSFALNLTPSKTPKPPTSTSVVPFPPLPSMGTLVGADTLYCYLARDVHPPPVMNKTSVFVTSDVQRGARILGVVSSVTPSFQQTTDLDRDDMWLVASDTANTQYVSRIVETNQSSRGQVKIHYLGWSAKWDEWMDITSNRIKGILSVLDFSLLDDIVVHDMQTSSRN